MAPRLFDANDGLMKDTPSWCVECRMVLLRMALRRVAYRLLPPDIAGAHRLIHPALRLQLGRWHYRSLRLANGDLRIRSLSVGHHAGG